MKKVLGSMSKFIFAGFGIAVLALLMSLTYSALQRLFLGNFTNQMWGLVMFDIAAMCWALAYVFQSKSTGQYAIAGIGFIVGFVGTMLMVASEVMLSGQTLTPEQAAQIAKWMTYGFIIVTALHAALVYSHHALAPDIREEIEVGIARGEIVTTAINDATKVLDEQKQSLSYSIRNDIISKAKRDLGLIEADPRMPIIPRKYEQAIPYPVEDAQTTERPLSRFRDWVSKRQKTRPQNLEQLSQTSDALCAWQETSRGRERIWCKVCRDEGAPWLSPEPCSHVLSAQNPEKVSIETAWATLKQLMTEQPASKEAPHLQMDLSILWSRV